jgi:hypothetical protein
MNVPLRDFSALSILGGSSPDVKMREFELCGEHPAVKAAGRAAFHTDPKYYSSSKQRNKAGFISDVFISSKLVRVSNDSSESCPRSPKSSPKTLLVTVLNTVLSPAMNPRLAPWPFGERLHGKPGLIGAYMDMLELEQPVQLVGFLECLSHKKIKMEWKCPCGSGSQLRDCPGSHPA